jgi:acyl carrier protein
MSEPTLSERILDIVLDLAPFPSGYVSGSTPLGDALGFDSLGLYELASVLESEFVLPAISADDSRNVVTVADVEQLIVRLHREAHGGT